MELLSKENMLVRSIIEERSIASIRKLLLYGENIHAKVDLGYSGHSFGWKEDKRTLLAFICSRKKGLYPIGMFDKAKQNADYYRRLLYLFLHHGADASEVHWVHLEDMNVDEDLLRRLMANGLDINRLLVDLLEEGIKPLRYATRDPHPKQDMIALVYKLVEWGADPDFQDKDGMTPFIYLCGLSHNEATLQLIRDWISLVDINRQDNSGRTALMALASHRWIYDRIEQIEVADLLLENGADLRLTNNYGETAADIVYVEYFVGDPEDGGVANSDLQDYLKGKLIKS